MTKFYPVDIFYSGKNSVFMYFIALFYSNKIEY